MNRTTATTRAHRYSHRAVALALAGVTMASAGCGYSGLNSLPMPGTEGHGAGSYTITVELPDVTALAQNSPVKIDDVTVGRVSGLRARQRPDGSFYAAVQLSLSPVVHLPANAVVRVAQTSLLGSQHIELAAPIDQPPEGQLVDGSNLPIASAASYPTTEEVLSSLGIVVNKGNLGALQDITDELYRAVAGRAGQFADFVPRLAELTAGIDRQSADIIAATERIDRFAATLARGGDALGRTLDTLPPALRVLNDNGAAIVTAFTALRRFAHVAAHLLSSTKTDLAADLVKAYPVVKALADNADDLVRALPALPTYPFPSTNLKRAVRGDFLNVITTFDLTARRLGESLFTTSALDPNMKHLAELTTAPDYLIGSLANLSGQAADPFQVPPTASHEEGTR